MYVNRNDNTSGSFFVQLSRSEALRLIESLAYQLLHENPNSGRVEFITETQYLSIAVMPEKE